jgi:hypothetical protein
MAIKHIEFQVIQKSTEACESSLQVIYKGRPYDLRLWVICGGEPAIDFESGGFAKRYKQLQKYGIGKFESFLWTNDRKLVKEDQLHDRYHYRYAGSKYAHQEFDASGNLNLVVKQGPTIADIGGARALKRYLDKHVPLRAERLRRWGMIQETLRVTSHTVTVISPRFRDSDECCYLRARLELRSNHLPPVTAESSAYSGRCDEQIAKFATPDWKAAQAFFTTAFDHNKEWETLTEKEFELALCLLKTISRDKQ